VAFFMAARNNAYPDDFVFTGVAFPCHTQIDEIPENWPTHLALVFLSTRQYRLPILT
jgi:hypothetical protein